MDEMQDDASIKDEENLLRRVPNWPNMVKFDNNTQTYRATSACFDDSDGGQELSVTLETPHLEDGGTYETAAKEPDFGLACVTAGVCRGVSDPSQKLVKHPTDEDPHHALIVGKKTKGQKRQLAKAASLVKMPVSQL